MGERQAKGGSTVGNFQDDRAAAERKSDRIIGETATWGTVVILVAAAAVTASFDWFDMPVIGDLCGLGIVLTGIGSLVLRINSIARRQGLRWLW